jgi:hypothetical protein
MITRRPGFVIILAIVFLSFPVWSPAQYIKDPPPPDVNKADHGAVATPTCWLATAANMLAHAGYGDAGSVQDNADQIYMQLVAEFGAYD